MTLNEFLKELRDRKLSHLVGWNSSNDTYHLLIKIARDQSLDLTVTEDGKFTKSVCLIDKLYVESELLSDLKTFEDILQYLKRKVL